jgi:hypothetical protein
MQRLFVSTGQGRGRIFSHITRGTIGAGRRSDFWPRPPRAKHMGRSISRCVLRAGLGADNEAIFGVPGASKRPVAMGLRLARAGAGPLATHRNRSIIR